MNVVCGDTGHLSGKGFFLPLAQASASKFNRSGTMFFFFSEKDNNLENWLTLLKFTRDKFVS